MKKILVATDLSSNSKAGLRFAIQLASQHKVELTFLHFYFLSKMPTETDEHFANYRKKEQKKILKSLNKFVEAAFEKMDVAAKNYTCVIEESSVAETSIKEYAQSNKFDFICISSTGAGVLKKIFGSVTSYLINHSSVPVIAVPAKYRASKIKTVLYSTDLKNMDEELKQVLGFTEPIKAKVELINFEFPSEILALKQKEKQLSDKLSKKRMNMHFKTFDLTDTLVSNIKRVVKRLKPSVLVMFTQQNRSFFDRIFLSSKSTEYAFESKVPLLVFNKG